MEKLDDITNVEKSEEEALIGGITSPRKKPREAGIELFRIITMILIVAHHYVVNSGLTIANGVIFSNPTSWRSLFLLLFGAWGKTGINCFVLITGYFMCKSKITLKKFLKLLAEILFYRWVIYAIFLISGYEGFSWTGLIRALLPISSVAQNFTGCYLLFFLCIPFLNILVQNMKEKQHIKLLLLLGVIYVFFGTFKFLGVVMNYVSWFSVLYLISSYVRLYPKKLFERTGVWGIIMLVSLFLSVASIFACIWLGGKINKSGLAYYFVMDSNTFLALATGFSSFMFFKNLKMKPNKLINGIAASTFGVLLIHASSDTMRTWLWKDVLNVVGMYSSQWLILHAIGSVLAIFIVCTVIDFIRIQLLEKPIFKCFEKREEKLLAWWKKKGR